MACGDHRSVVMGLWWGGVQVHMCEMVPIAMHCAVWPQGKWCDSQAQTGCSETDWPNVCSQSVADKQPMSQVWVQASQVIWDFLARRAYGLIVNVGFFRCAVPLSFHLSESDRAAIVCLSASFVFYLSGGEMGEQDTDPQVFCLAPLQLLQWQRPGQQPPQHRHLRRSPLRHCWGYGSLDGDVREEHRAVPEVCRH